MATQEQKDASDLGEQAIALAEELGRIAGTIGGTAESWLNRQQLTDQLTRVREMRFLWEREWGRRGRLTDQRDRNGDGSGKHDEGSGKSEHEHDDIGPGPVLRCAASFTSTWTPSTRRSNSAIGLSCGDDRSRSGASRPAGES